MDTEAYVQMKQIEMYVKLKELSETTGYPIYHHNSQRIYGPHPSFVGVPPHGSEVYISKIPHDAFEDELVPFLAKAGTIYKFRLMLTPTSIFNRGFAYVMYSTPEEALQAVTSLNETPFRPMCFLNVEKSLDNCRIFIGGIPDQKTKDDVWQELVRSGMVGIVDVIMYRSYRDRSRNRGFVFVEFQSHREAAEMRNAFRHLRLWNDRVYVDWSAPLPDVSPDEMSRVKKIFIRNLDVTMTRQDTEAMATQILQGTMLEKVYKFKDYAFLHFGTRRDAQRALELFKDRFKYTDVEVMWAIPQKYGVKLKTTRDIAKSTSQKANNLQHSTSYSSLQWLRDGSSMTPTSSAYSPCQELGGMLNMISNNPTKSSDGGLHMTPSGLSYSCCLSTCSGDFLNMVTDTPPQSPIDVPNMTSWNPFTSHSTAQWLDDTLNAVSNTPPQSPDDVVNIIPSDPFQSPIYGNYVYYDTVMRDGLPTANNNSQEENNEDLTYDNCDEEILKMIASLGI